jgi:hypothetical protein
MSVIAKESGPMERQMSLDPSSYRRAQYDQRSPSAAQHEGRRHEW